MISLSVGTSLEKSVQGHLASDSESSAVVESRVHFKKKWSLNSVPGDQTWDQNLGPKPGTTKGPKRKRYEKDTVLPLEGLQLP